MQWFYFRVANTRRHIHYRYEIGLQHTKVMKGALVGKNTTMINTRIEKSLVISRFSIVNLSKGESLYSVGMRPLLYSVKDAQRNLGWRRCGDNIAYYRNDNG